MTKKNQIPQERFNNYKNLGLVYQKVADFSSKHTIDSSSGNIDIQQIIKGKDNIFVNEISEELYEKKKIIIRDWLLADLAGEELKEIYKDSNLEKIKFYQNLLTDGFALYAPIAGKLKQIKDVAELALAEFKTQDETKQELLKKGFTKDEVYIAGPINSYELIGIKIFEFRDGGYDLNDLANLLIKEFYNKGSCEIQLDSYNVGFSYPDYKDRDYKLNALYDQENLALVDHIKGGLSSDYRPNDNNSILSSFLSLKSATITDSNRFNFPYFAQLNLPTWLDKITITIYANIVFKKPNYEQDFNFHNLKKVNIISERCLYDVSEKRNIEILKHINLSSIKNLDLSYVSYSSSRKPVFTSSYEELKEIIQHFPSLQKITLPVKFSGEIRDFSLPPSLNEVYFKYKRTDDYSKVNFADFKELIKNCSHLKRLNLESAFSLSEYVYTQTKLPSSIEYISLVRSNINNIILKEIFISLPNLKALDLTKTFFTDSYSIESLLEGITIPEGCELIGIETFNVISPSNSFARNSNSFASFNSKNSGTAQEILNSVPSGKETFQIDSRTQSDDSVLKYTEYFKPKSNGIKIEANDYRLEVFTDLNKKSFIFKHQSINPQEIKITKEFITKDVVKVYNTKYEQSINYFLGKIIYKSGVNNYALPSLSVKDQLIGLDCQPNTRFKVSYSDKDNLYYLNLPYSYNDVTVNYIIKSNYASNPLNLINDYTTDSPIIKLKFTEEGRLNDERLYQLPEALKISWLINYFNGFENKELTTISPNATPQEIMNAVMEERAGVCRHGATAFTAAAKEIGLTARLVTNDVHAFVEVFYNNKWQRYDFGGQVNDVLETNNDIWNEGAVEINEVIEDVKELISSENDTATVIELIKEANEEKSNPFNIAANKVTSFKNIQNYVENLLDQAIRLDKKNILCIMSESQIEDFYLTLLKTNKNIYFISDLDKVYLKNAIIVENDAKLADSKLGKFLKQEQGVLLIDWSNRKNQHIGFNSIIDEERRVEEQFFSKDIVVISVIKKGIEMGEDFYSRHKIVKYLPENLYLENMPTTAREADGEITFYQDDWQTKLFGKIKIAQTGYNFMLPELVNLISKGALNINLKNSPLEDREFRLAINEIEQTGKIYVNGNQYECSSIKFSFNNNFYDLSNLKISEFDSREEYLVLNNLNLNNIFESYYVKDKKLLPADKLNYKLLITDELSDGALAKLSASDAEVIFAKGNNIKNDVNKIIVTNDLELYKKNYQGSVIIHINSETKSSDLFEKITYNNGVFTHKLSVMAKTLLAGEEVVLVGNPSNELAKHLQSLFINKAYMMLNGERLKFNGKLTLILEQIDTLALIDHEEKIYSSEEIWDEIEKEYPQENIAIVKPLLCDEIKENFSYTQVSSILKNLALKPNENPLIPMLKLRADYLELKDKLKNLWTPQEVQTKFSQFDEVKSGLELSPYVFIVGPSGVGKSRFVQKELVDYYNVYEGMENIAELTKTTKNGKANLLFLDEANLDAKVERFGIFNGLFEPEPKLLIDGELFDVPQENKIIFAGNYGYFKNRKTIEFIAQHGCIINFDPISDDILKNEVIKPVLAKLPIVLDMNDLEIIYNQFIKTYHYINENFGEALFLTARNLQMMSLRCAKLYQQGINNPALLASIASYEEVEAMINREEREELQGLLLDQVERDLFITKNQELENSVTMEDFFIADSRKKFFYLFEQMLFIRDLKINNQELSATGISGLLVEGPSGIGKSYSIVQFLEYNDFVNGAKEQEHDKKYYIITPTNYGKAKALLEKAFHEGAVVIIDEINTMPMEKILNPLLSGVDFSGKTAQAPGFMIIGTQNPINFVGRIAFSDALNNRFQKICLNDYTKNELIDLLKASYTELSIESLTDKIDLYQEAINETRANNLPAPNLRQLINHFEDNSNEVIRNESLFQEVEVESGLLGNASYIHIDL